MKRSPSCFSCCSQPTGPDDATLQVGSQLIHGIDELAAQTGALAIRDLKLVQHSFSPRSTIPACTRAPGRQDINTYFKWCKTNFFAYALKVRGLFPRSWEPR